MAVEHEVLEDPNMSLAEWCEFLERMVDKYGADAKMYTDGGYNNVSIRITEE